MTKSDYIKELEAERERMLDYIRERGHSIFITPETDEEDSNWEAGYARALEDVIFCLRRKVK